MSKQKTLLMIAMGCVISDDKILLIRRNEPSLPEIHDKWELPGGKVEFGENIERTCEREVFEETGVIAKAGNMFPFPFVAVRKQSDRDLHVSVVCFECELMECRKVELESKISEVKWFRFSEIDPVWVQSGSLRFLNHVMTGRGYETSSRISRTHSVSLCSFDPSSNRNRQYSISIEHDIGAKNIFTVHTNWGPVGGWQRGKQEHFTNRDDMIHFVEKSLVKREKHGYLLKAYTENFPNVTIFELLKEKMYLEHSNDEDVQMKLI